MAACPPERRLEQSGHPHGYDEGAPPASGSAIAGVDRIMRERLGDVLEAYGFEH